MNIFLNRGTIGNDIIRFHDVLVTHTKFLNKLHNLLVLLSHPEMESRIRSILKYASDIPKAIGIKVSGTLNILSIYQYCISSICDITPLKILEFVTLHVV